MSVELRFPSFRVSAFFLVVFVIAIALALFATFFAISGFGPIDRSSDLMIWLLAFNGLLIALLTALVVRRYQNLYRDRQSVGGGRLARRFVTVSSFAAIVPALLVAAFLGLNAARGLDYWFSDRVQTTVEETAEIARENLESVIKELDSSIRDLAFDLNQEGPRLALTEDRDLYTDYLRQQVIVRNLDTIEVINSSGDVLASSAAAPIALVPLQEDFEEADTGEVAIRLFETSGSARALFKLSTYGDAYIYARVESLSPDTLERLRRAEAAVIDYRATIERSERISILFALGYIEIALLLLLISTRLGLEAAASVTEPIGRLADAAIAVREGDLDVRVPVPSSDDEVTTLTRTFNDMTQQLAAQRAEIDSARQSAEDGQAFLAALLSDVNAGVIRTDESLEITIANAAALTLIGVTNSEITGLNLEDVVPEFVESASRSVAEQISSDVSLVVRHDGTSRHFRLKTSPDQTGGCVLTFDDTSRIVAAQRQMAWRDVARRIAHEIRNPLTPIQLSAERLKRRYAELVPEDDQTFERCTDTILRQVADIGRMVEEFSSFARMPKPTVEAFNLRGLLEHIAYSQRMVSPETEIVMTDAHSEVFVNGDERLLGQAFSNLLKNAAEAVERRPETDEFDGHIALGFGSVEDDVVVFIEDNGPGFPQDDRDRLLEPYVTNREGGTGLGLAIVSRIITDHGGSITLTNRSDQRRGARVEVRLPTNKNGAEIAGSEPLSTREELA